MRILSLPSPFGSIDDTPYTNQFCHAQEMVEESEQLLVVVTPTWDSSLGTLQLFEREAPDTFWKAHGAKIAVVVGKSGLAWGIGVHPIPLSVSSFKREGDKKAPAGIFSLGPAFGYASKSKMTHLSIEYLTLQDDTEY